MNRLVRLGILSLCMIGLVPIAGAQQSPQTPAMSRAEIGEPGRGFANVTLPIVSVEEAARLERAVQPRSAQLADGVQPLRTAGGLGTPAPASVRELARALKGDPDLIYDWVRNNIDYYPGRGVQKGHLGTILDGRGTSFDIARLMVALLREEGAFTTTTAQVVRGTATVTAQQLRDWLGLDTQNACAVAKYFGQGGLAVTPVVSASGCTPLSSVRFEHAWVRLTIGGTNYFFDPSIKMTRPGTATPADLRAAMGYNQAGHLQRAKQGSSTDASGNFIAGMNRANVADDLRTYGTNLTAWIRANRPAADLDGLIGGRTVVPTYGQALATECTTITPDGKCRQTRSRFQYGTTAPAASADFADTFRASLRVKLVTSGGTALGIDKTFYSDEIYATRLSLFVDPVDGRTKLYRNGVVEASTTSALQVGTPITARFWIKHPYAGGGADQTCSNQGCPQSIVAGGAYLISNAWGPGGRQIVDFHRQRLTQAKANGGADDSEAVLGSSLAVLAHSWIGQANFQGYVADRIGRTNTVYHHQVGIAGQNGAPYVDLPFNVTSTASETGDANREQAAFYSGLMHSSVFESAAVQQVSGVSAVSTVKLLDIEAQGANQFYNINSSNLNLVASLPGCAPYVPSITQVVENRDAQGVAANNGRVIMPARCALREAQWVGVGYFGIRPTAGGTSIVAAISGGLNGGFASTPQPRAATVAQTQVRTFDPVADGQRVTPSIASGPVDAFNGSYSYGNVDMTVGEGAMALAFERSYSSAGKFEISPLGRGWTHNWEIRARRGVDGFQGLGEDSALDAAATIAETVVSLDLLSDPAKPLDKMLVASLGQRWFADQLLDNTVIVTSGQNSEVFVKLPDLTYNPPPGSSVRLSTAGNYTYWSLNQDRITFDGTIEGGKAASFTSPNGYEVRFAYAGDRLSSVANSVGRSLSLGYTGDALTSVSDGIRTVRYQQDGAGNLQWAYDTLNAGTRFEYDEPGRISKVFSPSFPGSPLVNAYDTLGRLSTQTNPNNDQWTYLFSGWRSEERDPTGKSKATYHNPRGRVVASIDATGRRTTIEHDGRDRPVITTYPENNSVITEYDDVSCVSPERRCTNNVRRVTRRDKAQVVANDLFQLFTYEPVFNQLASSTDWVATDADAAKRRTDVLYTARGEPERILGPAPVDGATRPETTYSYTAYGSPVGFPAISLRTSETRRIDALTTTTTAFAYDPANRLAPASVTVDPGGLNLMTTFQHNAVGDRTLVDGPRADVSDVTQFAFDSERRLFQTTDALGKATRSFYDLDGRPLRVAAQIGSEWLTACSRYTVAGKLARSWGPVRVATDQACPAEAAPTPIIDHQYNARQEVYRTTEVLAAGEGPSRVTEFVYDDAGRPLTVKKAVGVAGLEQTYVAYQYTGNGQRRTAADARGNVTTYVYDNHDRLQQLRYPQTANGTNSAACGLTYSAGHDCEFYTYHPSGTLATRRNRAGKTIAFSYDFLNRLTFKDRPDSYTLRRPDGAGGRSIERSYDTVYRYDLLGRVTNQHQGDGDQPVSYVYDKAGRLIQETESFWTVDYAYDPAGNRTRLTYPYNNSVLNDGFFVETSYDALNRPFELRSSDPTPGASHGLGAHVLARYDHDDLSRETRIRLGNGMSRMVAYDAQSRPEAMGLRFTGLPQYNTDYGFTHNQLGERTAQTTSTAHFDWFSHYNVNRAYTANGLNQYATSGSRTLGYDANGNLAGDGTSGPRWAFAYSDENELSRATQYDAAGAVVRDISYIYNGAGKLRERTNWDGTNIRYPRYDGDDIIAEHTPADGFTPKRRFVHGPGIDEPLVQYDKQPNGTWARQWLMADATGSIVATGDDAGGPYYIFRYGPFGEPHGGGDIRLRYTGQWHDEDTGLYYYKARWYSPWLGRFLQPDPAGDADGPNLYAYVGNDPINLSDPTGMFGEAAGGFASGRQGAGATVGNTSRNVPIHNLSSGDIYQSYFAGALNSIAQGALDVFSAGVNFGSVADIRFPRATIVEPRSNYYGSQGRALTQGLGAVAGGAGGAAARVASAERTAAAAFFRGTRYTDKVLRQMRSGDLHAFPESVRTFAGSGRVSAVRGGDGITRRVLIIPGRYKGRAGDFRFIKEADGSINHRQFHPRGS